jgi:5-methylcytosine-specific restriction endonuclease McrA
MNNTLKQPLKTKEKIGMTFGYLTITDFGYYKKRSDGNRDAFWKCKCQCGNEKFATFSNMNNGNVLSCGCMIQKRLKELHKNNIDDTASFRKVLTEYRNSARKSNRKFTLTETEFGELTSGNCSYCGIQPSKIKDRNGKHEFKGEHYIYNGIDRVDNNRGYEKDNCVSCCRRCNIAKASMTRTEFLNWISDVYNWNKLLDYDPHPAIKGEVAV